MKITKPISTDPPPEMYDKATSTSDPLLEDDAVQVSTIILDNFIHCCNKESIHFRSLYACESYKRKLIIVLSWYPVSFYFKCSCLVAGR